MLNKAKKKAALKNLVTKSKKGDNGESAAADKGEAARYAFLSKFKKK